MRLPRWLSKLTRKRKEVHVISPASSMEEDNLLIFSPSRVKKRAEHLANWYRKQKEALATFILGSHQSLLDKHPNRYTRKRIIQGKIIGHITGTIMAAGQAVVLAIPAFTLFFLPMLAFPVAMTLAIIAGLASFWVNRKLFTGSVIDIAIKHFLLVTVHNDKTNQDETIKIDDYKRHLAVSSSLALTAAIGFAVVVFFAMMTITGGIGGLILASAVAAITFAAQSALLMSAFRKLFAYAQLKSGFNHVIEHFWKKFKNFYSFEDCKGVDNDGKDIFQRPGPSYTSGYNKVAVARKAISMVLSTLLAVFFVGVAFIATLGLVAIFDNKLHALATFCGSAGSKAADFSIMLAMRVAAFAGRFPVVVDNIARIAVRLGDWLSKQCIRVGHGVYKLLHKPAEAFGIIKNTFSQGWRVVKEALTHPTWKGFWRGFSKTIDAIALAINTVLNGIFVSTAKERINGDLHSIHDYNPTLPPPPSEQTVEIILGFGNAITSGAICGNSMFFKKKENAATSAKQEVAKPEDEQRLLEEPAKDDSAEPQTPKKQISMFDRNHPHLIRRGSPKSPMVTL